MNKSRTVNVTLPEPLDRWLDERVREGDFGGPGEYLKSLVAEDRARRSGEKLEALLLEGMATKSCEMTSEEWDAIRSEVRRRHEARPARPQ